MKWYRFSIHFQESVLYLYSGDYNICGGAYVYDVEKKTVGGSRTILLYLLVQYELTGVSYFDEKVYLLLTLALSAERYTPTPLGVSF